ncbi:uncharacterized protein VTP21DRAFT_2545 [Calcarisporiella thermophila]|uniref:uncharacterized protein n=1 Tax=Calcarisporiella thermophila TaxID=911321 RepID=UPI003742CA94
MPPPPISLTMEPTSELGTPIPAYTPHAVSVTLPKWQDNVDYEEGKSRVLNAMQTGYPRFFIHKDIQKLASRCEQKFARPNEAAMLFPSRKAAERCREFIKQYGAPATAPRLAEWTFRPQPDDEIPKVALHMVLFPRDVFSTAKSYWQHTGDGISSRLAEYCLQIIERESLAGSTVDEEARKGGRFKNRYRQKSSTPVSPSAEEKSLEELQNELGRDQTTYVEERYGRNLHFGFAEKAKLALRRRIAGIVDENSTTEENTDRGITLTENDVYLFPCGMNAIFHAHRYILEAGTPRKSVCFGFPYTDTLKVLQKFGPGCHFFGGGDDADIDALEKLLEEGERISALFCEFPSNPLLKSPDLPRLRALADKYDFCIVVDETIGNFVNVRVLPFADIVVSSLTKLFSGDSNVMGGSFVLNPSSPKYEVLQGVLAKEYEDAIWHEDSIFLERNSRNFVQRAKKIDDNAEALCEFLRAHPLVEQIYYPKFITSHHYEACKSPEGGYGGLFSVVLKSPEMATVFFDNLPVHKGPSLGTNFTLACPYTLLAHYYELDWALQFGVPAHLVRVSVGLESTEELLAGFKQALDIVQKERGGEAETKQSGETTEA